MPRRSDNKNPLVINSNDEFTEVGYLPHGTPVPVNILAGVITGANPTDGTLTDVKITGGTVAITGTLTGANPSDGTLSQLGTLYHVASVKEIGTLPNINVDHGTLALSGGTLQALPDININHGTVGVSDGTVLAHVDYGTLKISDGTLTSLPDINVSHGTLGISDGTLRAVTELGTLDHLVGGTLDYVVTVKELGTVDGLKGGTVDYLNTVTQLGTVTQVGALGTLSNLGTAYYVDTVKELGTLDHLAGGTVDYLNTVTQIGTLPPVTGTVGINAGTVNLSGLGTVRVDLGTIGISDGTLGTVNVYTKHDLHDYHSVGTVCTGQGTIAQTASKIIKVHYYKAQADGTYGFHFANTKPNGGTLDPGWYFQQREGVAGIPFLHYPAYLFKTTTVGSALCIGTWPSIPCSGTLRVSIVFTDDDVA